MPELPIIQWRRNVSNVLIGVDEGLHGHSVGGEKFNCVKAFLVRNNNLTCQMH